MNDETIFTAQHLRDWEVFERVRKGGRWNMFDQAARHATTLGGDEYSFVMKHYSKLKEAALRSAIDEN